MGASYLSEANGEMVCALEPSAVDSLALNLGKIS